MCLVMHSWMIFYFLYTILIFPNFLGSHCFQNLGEGCFVFFFFDSEISVSVKLFPAQVTLYVKIPVLIVGVVTKIPFPPLSFYLFIRLM